MSEKNALIFDLSTVLIALCLLIVSNVVCFSIVKILIIRELTKYLQPYFAHNQEFNFW